MTPPDCTADLTAVAQIDVVETILEVVCRTTGLGFAAVARVTEDRWIACAVRDEIAFGLEPGGELQVATTLCDEIRGSGELIVIDHADADAKYSGHPTPKMYGFQSYISVPIRRRGGEFFGTLCAIDPKPAQVSGPATIGMFTLFADLIAFHLDAQDRLTRSEQALLDERQIAELREQFIAVLGHDLRTPLAAIDAGTAVLATLPLEPRGSRMVGVLQRSSARMRGLIDDVLDFARTRLGGGLVVSYEPDEGDLATTLEQVVSELHAAWPDRSIESAITLTHPVSCDRARIAQLLSNLLANALTHGDPAAPVRLRARTDEHGLELAVTNQGEPIPADTVERLFQPFSRASVKPGQPGLGLGLYISAEIARAHAGTIDVASSAAETRFTFRMPTATRSPSSS